MHIVDVAEFYAPLGGGVKTYIDAKLAFGHQNGVKVSVIAPGPEDRVERREGGQVSLQFRPSKGAARQRRNTLDRMTRQSSSAS